MYCLILFYIALLHFLMTFMMLKTYLHGLELTGHDLAPRHQPCGEGRRAADARREAAGVEGRGLRGQRLDRLLRETFISILNISLNI